MAVAYIYGLYDDEGSLRYIGKANDVPRRLASHMRDAKSRNTPLYAWIRKHGCPVAVVLEECTGDWREAEKRHILAARKNGAELLNLAEGGDEPFCPKAVRQENGKKVASAVHSDPERKAKWARKQRAHSLMFAAFRDGFVSEATKDKMRQRMDVFAAFKRYL